MRSFHGTASAIVLSGLAALALSGCVGQPDQDEAVAEAQAANVSTLDPGGPEGTDPTTGLMPTLAPPPMPAAPYPPTGYPPTGTPPVPGGTCACLSTGAAPGQGLPEQGVPAALGAFPTAPAAPPQGVPAQGVPTQTVPTQTVPAQGGLPCGGGGFGAGCGIPIVSGCCCLPANAWLAAWFAGPPLCMRL
jgi:hypothetical protein